MLASTSMQVSRTTMYRTVFASTDADVPVKEKRGRIHEDLMYANAD